MIPCEFCHSTYPLDLISEHQILCLIGNGSLMLATEDQTEKSDNSCDQVKENSKTSLNSHSTIAQGDVSKSSSSKIHSTQIKSKKPLHTVDEQLKPNHGKSLSISQNNRETSSTTSSSSTSSSKMYYSSSSSSPMNHHHHNNKPIGLGEAQNLSTKSIGAGSSSSRRKGFLEKTPISNSSHTKSLSNLSKKQEKNVSSMKKKL
ncbi:unnamed protein product [Schistosoma turkestanicum]|nr:unnamed protein product [Schistosoma turkestanicum]